MNTGVKQVLFDSTTRGSSGGDTAHAPAATISSGRAQVPPDACNWDCVEGPGACGGNVLCARDAKKGEEVHCVPRVQLVRPSRGVRELHPVQHAPPVQRHEPRVRGGSQPARQAHVPFRRLKHRPARSRIPLPLPWTPLALPGSACIRDEVRPHVVSLHQPQLYTRHRPSCVSFGACRFEESGEQQQCQIDALSLCPLPRKLPAQ
eukprot:CAMPEP_0179875716 /NCGR_PEP_ID=MMETSP0982-20121206/23745_1 /TAXON_ID=483367 /ORGANISM="non described non described, Strain CCMP 2436" /LENGTH=204 /DNA_ID=CAMNT_0021767947 /DNA_START=124 /DNA_END=739 /DNA_ORIENTATION=-